MTVKNGRFLNIGSKSYSVKELEELAEDAQAEVIEDTIAKYADTYKGALEQLLDEMASNQSKRKGMDPDLDFSNYEVRIEDVKTQTIAGKKRLKSVNVKVVNSGGDFNLFDLLDAGTKVRKAKSEDNPMVFPLYDGVLVEAGNKQEAVSIGQPELEQPMRWVHKAQVNPIKPRNLYSRVRNQLTQRAKRIEEIAKSEQPQKTFENAVEKQPELNFYAKNIRQREKDRKVLSFQGIIKNSVDVKVKLRGG